MQQPTLASPPTVRVAHHQHHHHPRQQDAHTTWDGAMQPSHRTTYWETHNGRDTEVVKQGRTPVTDGRLCRGPGVLGPRRAGGKGRGTSVPPVHPCGVNVRVPPPRPVSQSKSKQTRKQARHPSSPAAHPARPAHPTRHTRMRSEANAGMGDNAMAQLSEGCNHVHACACAQRCNGTPVAVVKVYSGGIIRASGLVGLVPVPVSKLCDVAEAQQAPGRQRHVNARVATHFSNRPLTPRARVASVHCVPRTSALSTPL